MLSSHSRAWKSTCACTIRLDAGAFSYLCMNRNLQQALTRDKIAAGDAQETKLANDVFFDGTRSNLRKSDATCYNIDVQRCSHGFEIPNMIVMLHHYVLKYESWSKGSKCLALYALPFPLVSDLAWNFIIWQRRSLDPTLRIVDIKIAKTKTSYTYMYFISWLSSLNSFLFLQYTNPLLLCFCFTKWIKYVHKNRFQTRETLFITLKGHKSINQSVSAAAVCLSVCVDCWVFQMFCESRRVPRFT